MFNTIYNKDCLQGMKNIGNKSVDLILTSPPYNIGKEYEDRVNLSKYLEWQKELIGEYSRLLKNSGSIAYQVGNYINKGSVYPLDCLLFEYFLNEGFIPRNRIVWTFGHGLHCKKRLSGRHEIILWFSRSEDYTFNLDEIRVPQKYPNKKHYKGNKVGEFSCNPLGKNPSDVWDITNVKNNHPEKTEHPCQYPLQLAERVIKAFSNKNDLVLDPFIGSGTTAVACLNTKRQYIGFELDKTYFDIACKRIGQKEGL